MESLLLILLLILYGEGSTCKVTRQVSRTLLYTYTLSLVLSIYTEDLQVTYIAGLFVHIVGIGYCASIARTWQSLSAFGITFLLVASTYLILIIPESYNTYNSIFINYSNVFYRESLLLCVILSTDIKTNNTDSRLNISACALWLGCNYIKF